MHRKAVLVFVKRVLVLPQTTQRGQVPRPGVVAPMKISLTDR